MCSNSSPRLPHSQGALCQQGQVPQSPPDKGGLFSPGQGGWLVALATLAHSCCQHDPETDKKPQDKPWAVLGCWLWGVRADIMIQSSSREMGFLQQPAKQGAFWGQMEGGKKGPLSYQE